MKKGLKNTIIITSSIAGAIILAIIILSAIVIRPLNQFTNADYTLFVANSPTTAQTLAHQDEIKEELESVRFSLMRALLESNADYKIKNATQTVDDEKENVKLTASDFLSVRPTQEQYMLRFSYEEIQTNNNFKDDNGCKIKYNTLIIIINTSSGHIQPVTLYPYIDGNLSNNLANDEGMPLDTADENGRINSAYYKVYEFNGKMYTSSLFDLLDDKGFTTGEQA